MKKENIPNILTIIRFILIPFIFTSVVNEDFLATIVIFTISAITDMLDGYIARKYNYITDIGLLQVFHTIYYTQLHHLFYTLMMLLLS